MVSSYTANLAMFLIVQDLEDTIKSLEDLPKQNKVHLVFLILDEWLHLLQELNMVDF
jgi:hypothetical protein